MADDAPSVRTRTVVIGVIVAAVIGGLLALGLVRMNDDPAFAHVPLNGTKPAPELEGRDLVTDAPIALSDYRGKPVVLNVWAEWCGPCRDEAPALKEFAEKNPDVAVLGIGTNNENRSVAQKFNAEMGWKYPSIFDADDKLAFDVLKVGALPATFYIDAQGIMRGKSPGVVTVGELEDVTERMQTPADTTTTP